MSNNQFIDQLNKLFQTAEQRFRAICPMHERASIVFDAYGETIECVSTYHDGSGDNNYQQYTFNINDLLNQSDEDSHAELERNRAIEAEKERKKREAAEIAKANAQLEKDKAEYERLKLTFG